jgi:hypothetical protein
MRHPIRGLLIGPLVVPIAYWIGLTVYAWASDFSISGFQALRELVPIVSFGLPIAYLAALVWGAPLLVGLRRLGWLRASTVIAVGALGGTIVALGLAFDQQGSLFRVRLPVPAGAVLGALAGAACWWAGQGAADRSEASP